MHQSLRCDTRTRVPQTVPASVHKCLSKYLGCKITAVLWRRVVLEVSKNGTEPERI